MTRASICACAALVLAAPVSAEAAGAKKRGHTIFQSRALWSTIDVCNTALHPRTIGIRGSMPGSGVKQERMFMRFQLQYRSSAGAWSYIGSGADSGFVPVGAATFKARQSGRSFRVALMPGQRYVLRGVVSFEWRRGARVVRHAQKATTAEHHTTAGSDPKGYSAAACALA